MEICRSVEPDSSNYKEFIPIECIYILIISFCAFFLAVKKLKLVHTQYTIFEVKGALNVWVIVCQYFFLRVQTPRAQNVEDRR